MKEKNYKGKTIIFEYFLIKNGTKEQYPFYDLNIIKDDQIKRIGESSNYDLIFIGYEHKDFKIDNQLYDIGSSGCRKDNKTRYTIFDTETFKVETRIIEYNRENFKKNLLKIHYPDRNQIAKWFFGIELQVILSRSITS